MGYIFKFDNTSEGASLPSQLHKIVNEGFHANLFHVWDDGHSFKPPEEEAGEFKFGMRFDRGDDSVYADIYDQFVYLTVMDSDLTKEFKERLKWLPEYEIEL